MIFNKCPDCGANLDPGEYCDCQNKIVNEMTVGEEQLLESGYSYVDEYFYGSYYCTCMYVHSDYDWKKIVFCKSKDKTWVEIHNDKVVCIDLYLAQAIAARLKEI